MVTKIKTTYFECPQCKNTYWVEVTCAIEDNKLKPTCDFCSCHLVRRVKIERT